MSYRRKNHAMIAFMDESVGNITAALTQRGMWNRTLLVWSADNGGAVHLGGGANAYPLRGGYENNWEGCVNTYLLSHSLARSYKGKLAVVVVAAAVWWTENLAAMR